MKLINNYYLILVMLFFGNTYAKNNETCFVVDICSYNNSEWYKKNLDSVFDQKYDNYHVIYTDDCSSDGTGDLVAAYVKERGLEDRVTLIRNTHRRRQLANHWVAAQLCDDDDVIVVLDGDDWFNSKLLFARLNDVYKDDQIWTTYGQYRNWPTKARGYCHPTNSEIINNNKQRDYLWFWGHTRTYYAWLAKQVKLQDLIISDVKHNEQLSGTVGRFITEGMLNQAYKYQGCFFPASADLAFGYPMLEMAGHHIKYIPKVYYLRNVANTINTFKTQGTIQQYSARYIRSKEHYNTLSHPVKRQKEIEQISQIDMVTVYNGDFTVLTNFLESINNNITGLGTVYIACGYSAFSSYEEERVKALLAQSEIIKTTESSFEQELKKIIEKKENAYILCSADHEEINYKIDLAFCAQMLEKTFAYGFYLSEKDFRKLPLYEWTGFENVCFWQFGLNDKDAFGQGYSELYAEGDVGSEPWREPFGLSLALYRKSDMREVYEKISRIPLEDFQESMLDSLIDKKKIGLFYY